MSTFKLLLTFILTLQILPHMVSNSAFISDGRMMPTPFSESTRITQVPSANYKNLFSKYIKIYSNNYLNSGSQLQLSEECKQSCTIQFSVFHFFSLPMLLLQPFTALVNTINIELNYNTSKYYLEQISIEIFVVMIITVLYA